MKIGPKLLSPEETLKTSSWKCSCCGFVHSIKSDLPKWKNWPAEARTAGSGPADSFWTGFFRIHTEHPESYWKQCNVCGRIQPFQAFSKHAGWGPLERQMECRACKGAINAVLNPKRTKEQLHEGARRRRIAELLLKGEDSPPSFAELFERFDGKCFKTGRKLDINDRGSWEMDHILPAAYLYPLTPANACLLSREANQNKKSQWPSSFYTSSEMVKLARLTGANLALLSQPKPVVNENIDVDACVSRFLKTREGTDLSKRMAELIELLGDQGLIGRLSKNNRALLGI